MLFIIEWEYNHKDDATGYKMEGELGNVDFNPISLLWTGLRDGYNQYSISQLGCYTFTVYTLRQRDRAAK